MFGIAQVDQYKSHKFLFDKILGEDAKITPKVVIIISH